MNRAPLKIFIPHCSDVLSDHLPLGDSLVAFGFIKHLAERGHELYVTTERADLRESLPANVHLHVVEPRFTSGPLRRLEYMVRMRAHFQELRKAVRFDLIHQLNPVFAGLSLALWDADEPLVLGTYVAYWPEEKTAASWLKRKLRAIGLKARLWIAGMQQAKANVLLLTTPAARNRLLHPDEVEAKVRWLGHGIDHEPFSPASDAESDARLAVEQAEPSVLFLANLHERKGILTLLRAFAKVVAKTPACRLTVAGDGPLAAEARALAAQLGISGSVIFLGAVERPRVPELYRRHAVFCLPSVGEPYATAVLEAMSCGRAVVISDSGGLPFMVPQDGGLRFAPGNVEELAAALLRSFSDADLRRAMGAANRRKVMETLTWPKVIDRLEEIYGETIAVSKNS